MTRLWIIFLVLASGCFGGGSISGVCPEDRGGDVAVRLATLRCLTALVHTDSTRTAILARRIDREMAVVYRLLLEQPLLEEQLAWWKELYRLSTWRYPRREVLEGSGGVPITFVNAHHFSLPFWIRRSLQVPLGTLVHFDTHSDMEAIPRVDDVRRAVSWIREGRNQKRAWHVLAHAIHRNSMPVTGAVLAARVKEILWVKPGWVHQPVDFFRRSFFFARSSGFADPRPLAELERQGPETVVAAFQRQPTDYFRLFYDPADNRGRHLPRRNEQAPSWEVVPQRARDHQKDFERIHRLRFSALTADGSATDLERIVAAVPTSGFVLDVDLDYFLNVGSDARASDDPPSFGETALKHPGAISTVRAAYRIKRLFAAGQAAERTLVEARLGTFRRILFALDSAGKRPTIVSLADSSNLPFAFAREAREHRAYVPPHHSYWLRQRVVEVVREVFARGPRSVPPPRPANPARPAPRRVRALYARPGPEARRLRPVVVDALAAAVAWAGAAARDHRRAPHLPAYLLLLHAVASHGPQVELRVMARELMRYHAVETLRPPLFSMLLDADRPRLETAFRVLELANRYGSREAGIALAGARWLRGSVGLRTEPDVDAEAGPMHPRAALELLGFGPAFAGGEPDEVADVLLGLQGRDGGFGPPDAASSARAALSLVAVRGLLGLLRTSRTRREVAKRGGDWSVLRGRATVAIRRAAAFAVGTLGEKPPYRDAAESLVLLHAISRLRGHRVASWFAAVAGRLLADRVLGRMARRIPGASLGELAGLAEVGRALHHFGIDTTELTDDLASEVGRARPGDGPPRVKSDLAKQVAAHGSLAALGVAPRAYEAAFRRALRKSAAPLSRREIRDRVVRFSLVANLLYTASAGRRVVLSRNLYASEWRYLDRLFPEVMRSGQSDLTATYLDARRILGDDERSPRVRDLFWQVLHTQQADGGWGRGSDSERLRSTWTAVRALGDFVGGGPNKLTEIAAGLAGERSSRAR